MEKSVFLTGGTGFLGTELAGRMVRRGGLKIYALVRAQSEEAAAGRLRASWDRDRVLRDAVGSAVIPVCGDFTVPGLGLDEKTLERLRDDVSLVMHAGAEIGFQKDEAELDSVNREGTSNVLSLAAQLPGLKRFVHISTAYVAGQKKGLVTEEEPAGTVFSSLYEKSKAEAETLVRESGLPFSICRPGMIVGSTADGHVKNFNTIYYVLRMMLIKKLPVIPTDEGTRLNLVPVDYVADAVLKIALSPDADGRTFHLTCPTALQPRVGQLAKHVRAWAKKHLDVDLPAPVCLPLDPLGKAGLAYNRVAQGRRKSAVTNFLTLLPYFYGAQDFDRSNTDAVAGPFDLQWQEYINKLLDYACRKNFMRQTGQSVFEQAMVRRASTRYPVRYYDVRRDGIRMVTGQTVNERIMKTVLAMHAHGIRPGDRVALTGIKSVHYMILDQAIGLLGAVSVPIYYTTPVDEIGLLLDRSGAGWFFVGDSRIMQGLCDGGRLPEGVKTVAFSRGQDVSALPSYVMPWKTFLRVRSAPPALMTPDPDALATIRYTSGTTGEPKGVTFTYRQLAWMGEVMTNILPWEDRNRAMRYLSFLPLSHVVEGILAAYAPYYLLAKVDYYYLNDFDALAETLPKVRPNVFFSVPRFYEKLWETFSGTGAGSRWCAMPEGPAKKAAAAALRRVLLRRAGLDACRQLIVGSAPVQESLLLNFRALGIEIHNAYGETEAPLITINRLGNNLFPSVGTPLPETEVTVLADGELLVRGPQVTPGYYGLESDSIRDGALYTGDLGSILGDGHVLLHGRKKEMIVTAYGKNISIPKLESRLRDLPGVQEAVLIGENRPYCTALLWLGEDADEGVLDQAVGAMNAGLSHPEQIRRYCAVSRPFSIQAGELTPNLKIRRGVVQEHFRDEIEGMYR